MRPVCSKCEVELRPYKNGVLVIEHADFGPYKIWEADEYKCSGCGIAIVTGFGEQPIAEHWQEDRWKRWTKFASSQPELVRNNYEHAKQVKQ